MPQFETRRPVKHSPDRMYALVADIERYPEFLPLCEALTIRSRRERDGKELLLADMTVGYKAIRETFTSRVTLDPAERHGFQYQSWFGFTLYAEGARGTLGRGGTYRVGGGEPATGFSLYIDPLVGAMGDAPAGDLLFLPEDHDRDAAARLRAIGWRTLAALDGTEDAAGLGCTHRLVGKEPQPV